MENYILPDQPDSNLRPLHFVTGSNIATTTISPNQVSWFQGIVFQGDPNLMDCINFLSGSGCSRIGGDDSEIIVVGLDREIRIKKGDMIIRSFDNSVWIGRKVGEGVFYWDNQDLKIK